MAAGRARRAASGTVRAVAPAQPVAWMLLGSALLGTGVALLIRADIGLAPYDVFLSSIADRAGVTHGQAGWLVAGTLMLLAAALGRRPRLTTLLFVLANGVAIDVALPVIQEPSVIATRGAFAGSGMALIATGVALVVHSGGTGGAFELIIAAMRDRGLRPVPVRTTMELTMFGTGIVLGGAAGPMTLVFAVGFGPLVLVIDRALDDHRTGRALRLTSIDPVSVPDPRPASSGSGVER